MTKAELIDAIAEKANLSQAEAKSALEAFISSVTDALNAGSDVRLVGFGSFLPVTHHKGRDPRTGVSGKSPKRRSKTVGKFVEKTNSGRELYLSQVQSDSTRQAWSLAFKETK